MGTERPDPTAIRVIAVTASDVVAAFEANRQRDAGAVLRVTPPFSGRMRARLHVAGRGDDADAAGDTEAPAAVHVPPADLLAEDAPAYPTAAETEDELRADPDAAYTVERHRERHERALSAWRERVRGHFVDEVTVETPGGPHTVEVTVLG